MAVRAASWAFFGVLLRHGRLRGGMPAAAPPASPSDSLPVATDARLGGDETQTRFVMDLSRKIDLQAFTLADPYRVVVDIPQVVFQLPPKTGESGRGLIKAFRFGLVMQGGSRLVFDLAKPDDRQGVRRRFDRDVLRPGWCSIWHRPIARSFLRADRRSTIAAARADAPRVDASLSKRRRRYASARRARSRPRRHRHRHQGARAAKKRKISFSNFAQRLRERIEKTGKYRVLMTRTDDTFVPLADRVRMARDAGAALFVSIHADALPRGEGDAQGASIYTLSDTASDSEAARLAEKENRADVIAGVDLKSRAGRCRRYPDRSRAARDQELLDAIRPQTRRRDEGGDAHAQEAAEVGGLSGFAGARRAFGAGRTRLRLQPARICSRSFPRLAQPDGEFDRAGDR